MKNEKFIFIKCAAISSNYVEMKNENRDPFDKSHTVKPVLSGHSKRRQKIGFQDPLLLNAGQKYCRMLRE